MYILLLYVPYGLYVIRLYVYLMYDEWMLSDYEKEKRKCFMLQTWCVCKLLYVIIK